MILLFCLPLGVLLKLLFPVAKPLAVDVGLYLLWDSIQLLAREGAIEHLRLVPMRHDERLVLAEVSIVPCTLVTGVTKIGNGC